MTATPLTLRDPDPLTLLADSIERLEGLERRLSFLPSTQAQLGIEIEYLHRAFRLLSAEAGIVPLVTVEVDPQ